MSIFARAAFCRPKKNRAVFVSDKHTVTPSIVVKTPMMSFTTPCAYERSPCLSAIHHRVGVTMRLAGVNKLNCRAWIHIRLLTD